MFLARQGYCYDPQASQIKTKTTNFTGILSASDTDVQKALDTIDNINIPNMETDPLSLHLTGSNQAVTQTPTLLGGAVIDDTLFIKAGKKVYYDAQ